MNFLKNCAKNMGRKMSGKDGLNKWVKNFKDDLVEKLVGKWVE